MFASTLQRLVLFAAEDSPSGLGRTLGKRVGGNPSRVRISYPPPLLSPGNTSKAPAARCGGLRRWRWLVPAMPRREDPLSPARWFDQTMQEDCTTSPRRLRSVARSPPRLSPLSDETVPAHISWWTGLLARVPVVLNERAAAPSVAAHRRWRSNGFSEELGSRQWHRRPLPTRCAAPRMIRPGPETPAWSGQAARYGFTITLCTTWVRWVVRARPGEMWGGDEEEHAGNAAGGSAGSGGPAEGVH